MISTRMKILSVEYFSYMRMIITYVYSSQIKQFFHSPTPFSLLIITSAQQHIVDFKGSHLIISNASLILNLLWSVPYEVCLGITWNDATVYYYILRNIHCTKISYTEHLHLQTLVHTLMTKLNIISHTKLFLIQLYKSLKQPTRH